jgi:hydrogenase maturation protease
MHFVCDTFPETESRREVTQKIAVIGVGQSLRGDDAVGLEAVRQWQEKFPETASRSEVRVEANELPGLTLLDMLSDVNAAILVDAIQSSAKPGTLHCLNEDELMSFTFSGKSAHGWGVAETLKLGRQLLLKIPPLQIIGVEAEQMQMGTKLSETVQRAVPKICELIEETVNDLLK